LRRSTGISLITVAAIAGVVLGRQGLGGWWWLAGSTATALVLARTRLALLGLMLLALSLGVWRAGTWTAQRAQLTALIGQTVTVTGTVADDPATSAHGQIQFNLGNLRLDGRRLAGTLAVSEHPGVFVQRGYQLELTGKVRPGFGNQVAELSYPQYTILSSHQDPLEKLRQRFFAGIRTALPEPTASFGLGLLIGIRALIPKPLQEQLALVGLSHLVAVSGYNLTIIVQAIHRLLHRAGRGIALAASLWFIGVFLILTGATASIVRASLVSVLSLLASYYGRKFQPVTLIALAAGATALYNPGYLTDLGWLLSFLAFFGILVLAPAVEARLGHPKLVLVRLLIESTCAQIVTIPLILYIFGQLSIVSPITNFLLLPLVPFAMATGFVSGLAGMFIPAFCGWLAWPATLVLKFMLGLIGYFAHLPWAGTTNHLSLPGLVVAYGLILALTIALTRANRRRPVAKPAPKPLLEPVIS
jgi:ComEC/Rec2-related protein